MLQSDSSQRHCSSTNFKHSIETRNREFSMPYRLLSRCYRLSFVCLCLWSTLAYLWCFISTEALIVPNQFCKTPSIIHYGTTSYGALAGSEHGPIDIISEYSSRYATSVSLRSFSLARTIGRKSPRILDTSVHCLKADSTFEESESVTDEINDILDTALGEVRTRLSFHHTFESLKPFH